jgi:predicted TIM-barrel enzyme
MSIETIPGTKAVATRIVNAEENFVQIIIEKGFTKDEAFKAMRTMLKLKVAKLDAIIGRITVKHGAYLEASSIRNAVNY